MSSSDGFCSCLVFAPGELGTPCPAPSQPRPAPNYINTNASSGVSTPSQTPTQSTVPLFARPSSSHGQLMSASPSQSAHPGSPARSMSISSATTQESHAIAADQSSDPARIHGSSTPHISSVPSLTAASTTFTPPQTPAYSGAAASQVTSAAPMSGAPTSAAATGVKREADAEHSVGEKKRRVAPTLLSDHSLATPLSRPSAPSGQSEEQEK